MAPGSHQPTNMVREANARWERAILLAAEGLTIPEICRRLGVTTAAYAKRRERHRDWYALFRAAQRQAKAHTRYDGSFESFRQHYLGMYTTLYMHRIVDAIEGSQPGEITLILIPPDHAKTTLVEDWCTFKLINDPSFRILIGSETVDHSRKILSRVRERLEHDGPVPAIAKDFGPFAPTEGRSSQPWGSIHFSIAGKRATDERDFSMNTIGLTGRVQGSRCDLLVLDDIQDVKSLGQSEKYRDIIVQSFLSRPGESGKVVIIGTRVGEFDVYRLLMDAGIPDRMVQLPAYDVQRSPTWEPPWILDPKRKPRRDDPSTLPPDGVRFLWGPDVDTGMPGRFSPFFYAQKRHQVGEATWARVYMQHPEASTKMTFSKEVTDFMQDLTRGVGVNPMRGPLNSKAPVVLSLDPSIGGGNGTLVAAMYPDRMDVLDCRLDYELTSFSQIFQILGEYCWTYTTADSYIEEVVIEDKAFQRGLLLDDTLIELQRRYGFRVVPNTTGAEKTHPDIGVPAMPHSMRRREMTIPWASFDAQEAMAPLLNHLHRWRPRMDGVKLPQDMVMALWFAWRRWRAYRDTPLHAAPATSQFNCRPSPLRPKLSHRPMLATRR